MTTPLVSVVIPCFKNARFLGDAIESVLAQTHQHVEIIVVDDGSPDNAGEVASRYPGVRCVRQSNQGVAAARNLGLTHSRGSYVVFLDADDRLRPDALSVGLSELEQDSAAAFAAGQCAYIAFDGTPLPNEPVRVMERDAYAELLRNCNVWICGVMFRRASLTVAGGFDTSLKASADHDIYLRIARRNRIRSHGQVVAEYRRHGLSMARNPAVNLRDRIRVLRRQRWSFEGSFRPYRQAYREGLAFAREYWGEPLAARFISDVATGSWRRALQNYRTLVAYHPRAAAASLTWCAREYLLR